MRIALATCLEMPGLIDEDHALAAAFARRGHEAVPAPWNGPFTPFADADITLVRTTWDYTEAPNEFATWLQRLEGAGCHTINPPALMRWNMDKHYLLELQSRGAPLPSTVICAPDPEEIVAAAAGLGLATAVLKPVISATDIRNQKSGCNGSWASDESAQARVDIGIMPPIRQFIDRSSEVKVMRSDLP